MRYALFLDTMVYLHYRPVDQVEWDDTIGATDADEIVVVVPGITLREIDKHKNDTPRLRARAQRVGEQLVSWLSAGGATLRGNARIEGALHSPNIDLVANGFDPSWNDDVLIASAVGFAKEHPDIRVIVISQDGYPRVKAAGLGLTVKTMPDNLKLPVEEDQVEKENRELKRQLQQFQSARPILEVEFGAGGRSLTISATEPAVLSDSEIAEKLRDLEQRYLPSETFLQKPSSKLEPGEQAGGRSLKAILRDLEGAASIGASLRGAISKEELDRYQSRRAAFLEAYPAYLRNKREYDRARARRFSVELILANTGFAPAEDIDLTMHFPEPLLVSDDEEVLHEPKAPTPPARPRGTSEILREHIAAGGLYRPFLTPQLNPTSYLADLMTRSPRNVSSLKVNENGGSDVTCHVGRVKHGLSETLPTIFVTLPESGSPRPFQITYTLHAANLPAPVEGELNVLFTQTS